MNHPNWMGDLLASRPNFGNLKINQVMLPGTHDSGTFRIGSDQASDHTARTQSLSFAQQLELGVRYFDLRVKLKNSAYYPYHGSWTSDSDLCRKGDNPDDPNNKLQFKQMRDFLKQHPKEIIILKFQGFWDLTSDQDYYDLVDLLKKYFNFPGCNLVTLPHGTAAEINKQTVNSLLAANKRVFLFFDKTNVPLQKKVWDFAFQYLPTLKKLQYGLWDPYWREENADVADDNIDLNIRWWPFHLRNLSTWNNDGFFVLQSHMQQLPGKESDAYFNISEQAAAANYYMNKDPQGNLIHNNARNIAKYIEWYNAGKKVNIVMFDFIQHGDVCGAIVNNYLNKVFP